MLLGTKGGLTLSLGISHSFERLEYNKLFTV